MATVNGKGKQSGHESRCLAEVRRWVEQEAEFHGRTDDDFLGMFLVSCDFDVELTKTTISVFYESRRQTPQWWANKSLRDPDVRDILNRKFATTLAVVDPDQPTITVAKLSKLPRSAPSATTFDSVLKASAILKEVEMRGRNCQRNGLVLIGDCADYPWWFVIKFLSPTLIKDFVSSFYLGLPVRIQKIVLLNASSLFVAGYKMIKPCLSESVQSKVHFCGYNLSELHQLVPKELLPVEYGGCNGSLEEHEKSFLEEVLSYADYFEDDNKYGFKEIDNFSNY